MTPEERQNQIKDVLKREIDRHPNDTIILYTSTTKEEENRLGVYGLIVAFLSTYADKKRARHEFAQFNRAFRCGRMVAISTVEERENVKK